MAEPNDDRLAALLAEGWQIAGYNSNILAARARWCNRSCSKKGPASSPCRSF